MRDDIQGKYYLSSVNPDLILSVNKEHQQSQPAHHCANNPLSVSISFVHIQYPARLIQITNIF